MNPFEKAILTFFSSLPAMKATVLSYANSNRPQARQSLDLAVHLAELVEMEVSQPGGGPLGELLDDWLTAARMHVNFRKVADAMLRRAKPTQPRRAPTPSTN